MLASFWMKIWTGGSSFLLFNRGETRGEKVVREKKVDSAPSFNPKGFYWMEKVLHHATAKVILHLIGSLVKSINVLHNYTESQG